MIQFILLTNEKTERMIKMKRSFISILTVVLLCVSLVACGGEKVVGDLWQDAVYTEDAEFGTGKNTISVEVKAEDKSVTFTINTDKKTVGEALVEHDLIAGEKGAYGMYIKVVNGITADYDKTQTYWSFSKNGEYMTTGVDDTELADGEHYELVYTK